LLSRITWHRSPQKRIDVRDFIQQNYHPYEGDESVLAAATQRTRALWNRLNEPDPSVVEAFTSYRETHNDAVCDASAKTGGLGGL
jgi:formate C-acetyltransferase